MSRIRSRDSWFVLLAAVVVLGLASLLAPARLGSIPRIAWICSLLSLGLALSTLAWGRTHSHQSHRRTLHWVYTHLALFLGEISAIILVLLVVMRGVFVGIDLLHGYPLQGTRDFGFSAFGLWSIGILCLTSLFSFLATRDGRILTLLFWLLVLLSLWACLLSNPFQPTRTGGFERTDATLILAECLAGLVLLYAIMVGWMLDGGILNQVGSGNFPPGLRQSVAVLCLVLNIGVLYHLLVPAGDSSSILRMSGLRAGFAGLAAAVGAVFLLRRSWGGHLADAALGLFALSLCGISTAAVPPFRIPLDQRYPMMFNAITIGYAMAGAVYAQLSHVWHECPIDPQPLRHRMVPHLNRFAFSCGAAALLSAVMMSFWPNIPGIAAMDHTFGRVLAGFAAFLFLLLVVLRSSRLLGRLSFHFLTVAVAASMIAFLGVRALPFVSEVH